VENRTYLLLAASIEFLIQRLYLCFMDVVLIFLFLNIIHNAINIIRHLSINTH